MDLQEASFIFSYGETVIGLPKALQNFILESRPHHSFQKRESEARSYSSGCNDDFAIFAFLAFLLTVLDLVMELQGGMGKRKKREEMLLKGDPTARNATLAAYAVFRGYLNAVDAENADCATMFLCEAEAEASKYGHIGSQLASITVDKALDFLMKTGKFHFKDRSEPMSYVISCSTISNLLCTKYPESYRNPKMVEAQEISQETQEQIVGVVKPLHEHAVETMLSSKT